MVTVSWRESQAQAPGLPVRLPDEAAGADPGTIIADRLGLAGAMAAIAKLTPADRQAILLSSHVDEPSQQSPVVAAMWGHRGGPGNQQGDHAQHVLLDRQREPPGSDLKASQRPGWSRDH